MEVFELPLAQALNAEEDLYVQLERGQAGFAIWQTTPGLVVTRPEARLAGFERASASLAADGWPIVVRGSGGGAVPQGSGLLNLTRVRRISPSAALSVESEYESFCGLLKSAFASFGVATRYGDVDGSFCDGRYNLVAGDRKLVGTAQRWSFRDNDRIAMAHALILIDADLSAACDAINHFYDIAGSDRRVRPEATINWQDRAPGIGRDELASALSAKLMEANAHVGLRMLP